MKNETPLEKLELIEKETRSFLCPCCNVRLQFRARVQIVTVGQSFTAEEIALRDQVPLEGKALKRANELAENDTLLAAAKRLGVFTAFFKALEVAQHHAMPNDPELYFVTWFTRVSRQSVPQFALRQCLDKADAEGDLSLYGFGPISAVMSDGEFKVFIPKKLVDGETIEKLSISDNALKPVELMNLRTWIRTKYGYVERSSEFAAELRKRSIGTFQLK